MVKNLPIADIRAQIPFSRYDKSTTEKDSKGDK